ncbi:hypothetical protein AVEN_145114-1 [Araneus ventricosus]|uniref:Gustatory receptor n=1 Tax=Araneus ventricosus TaxID=182803 RepID=A0A4Y2JF98_ARAVE|nr:hypothetical protein AVEN_145114-1 [Araneus ventricosus]
MRMDKITFLIRQLEVIRYSIELQDYRRVIRMSKITCVSAIAMIIVIPVVRALHYVLLPEYFQNCLINLLSEYETIKLGIYFLYEFADKHVNSTVMYAVSIFYASYCYSFSVSLRNIRKSSIGHKNQIYKDSIQILKAFEGIFSVVVFILFIMFFCTFFKMIFVFAFMFKYDETSIIYTYVLDFISRILLAIIVVLSADNLQREVRHSEYYFFGKSQPLDGRLIVAYNSHNQLELTDWGMFAVQKKLLLSMATWLFTYAVIIIQYYYAPSH